MKASPLLAALAWLFAAGEIAAQRPTPARLVMTPGTFAVRGGEVPVERGEISVPAWRAASGNDDTLILRFVRFPSTAAAPRPPIVFLAGGPGDGATRALAGMPLELLEELRAVADVIAFDQRGTGTSDPLDPLCPPPPPAPLDQPGDPAMLAAAMRRQLESCLTGAAARGIDVRGFTTEESADDLESLRRVLGAPSLQLLAGSYGTHLALATARRHPASVSAMVLLGVEGPDHTFKLPSEVDSVLARIGAARRPTLVNDVRTLRQRLSAEPTRLPLPDGREVVMGEWDLQRWIAESLDTGREIAALLNAIPALLAGDPVILARATLAARAPRPLNLMNLAMDCSSYASPDRLARIRQESEISLLGNAINEPKMEVCAVPRLPRLDEAFRAPLRSDIRTLLVAGGFDGRTPVSNAREVAAGMLKAEVLVVEEGSHDLFGNPEVMRRAVEWFGQ